VLYAKHFIMQIEKEELEFIQKNLNEYQLRNIRFSFYENWLEEFSSDWKYKVSYYGGHHNGTAKVINIEYVKSEKWKIGFGEDWFKSIDKLDNKLKGKLWKVIEKIKRNPCNNQGNTIKQLVGNFENIWRYRLGDWRIFYYPDEKFNNILFLHLSPRGGAYK
jgi:mRNA-degrading endonuclease RelE of RelBE toxin-antitoxin system